MTGEKSEDFPDKLPGPDYKVEIDWFYTLMIVSLHGGIFLGFLTVEKPWCTGVYSKF